MLYIQRSLAGETQCKCLAHTQQPMAPSASAPLVCGASLLVLQQLLGALSPRGLGLGHHAAVPQEGLEQGSTEAWGIHLQPRAGLQQNAHSSCTACASGGRWVCCQPRNQPAEGPSAQPSNGAYGAACRYALPQQAAPCNAVLLPLMQGSTVPCAGSCVRKCTACAPEQSWPAAQGR